MDTKMLQARESTRPSAGHALLRLELELEFML